MLPIEIALLATTTSPPAVTVVAIVLSGLFNDEVEAEVAAEMVRFGDGSNNKASIVSSLEQEHHHHHHHQRRHHCSRYLHSMITLVLC